MSIFMLKMIACITMFLDHIKYAIPQTRCFATQYLGRIAFPLFAFLIGEGYCHTSNLKKYQTRLILFALISQIPFMLFRTLVGSYLMLNILFTLFLGLIAIMVFDKLDKKYWISIPIVIGIIYFGKLVNVDYSWFGVATVYVLYFFRNQPLLRIFAMAILDFMYYYNRLVIHFSIPNLTSYLFTILPVFLLLFYHGKLGKKTKYFYYIFYPLHMLILFAISKGLS